MILRQPPDSVKCSLDRAADLFDKRQADLVEPLFLGQLLAHGRRTADDFRIASPWGRADRRPSHSCDSRYV